MKIRNRIANIQRNGIDRLPKLLFSKRKSLTLFCVVTVLLIVGVYITANNYQLYDTTIVRIDSAENTPDPSALANGSSEKHYLQILSGTVMNGDFPGKKIQLQNRCSATEVFDDQYKAGDEVFVTVRQADDGALSGLILGMKRDKYMAALCAALILFILIIARKKGLFTILSLSVNIALFWYALDLYTKGTDILFLSNCLVLLFTVLSLLFISGLNRKALSAILATLISIAATLILFQIVMMTTDGVDYAFMEYIASPNDLPDIFMSQIMLGGLGAIMDVSITEAATINELIARDKRISIKDLIKSGREVGHDIMGTMINVMLFTYISGSIPLIILKMNSDIKLHTIILYHMPMELYRFFIGSIGILLSIPVSLFVSILFFKKVRRFA